MKRYRDLTSEDKEELESAFKRFRVLEAVGEEEEGYYEEIFKVIRKYYKVKKSWIFVLRSEFRGD